VCPEILTTVKSETTVKAVGASSVLPPSPYLLVVRMHRINVTARRRALALPAGAARRTYATRLRTDAIVGTVSDIGLVSA
jgi:hypothetical protein